MSEIGDGLATLTLGTPIEDLAGLYPWLESIAEARNLPTPLRHAMHVALDEAVANIAMHGFGPDEEGTISLRLHATAEMVSIEVDDTGPAFDQSTAPAPERAANIEDAKPGGLGLTLLRHFCPDLSYRRVGNHNRLTLNFPVNGPYPPADVSAS